MNSTLSNEFVSSATDFPAQGSSRESLAAMLARFSPDWGDAKVARELAVGEVRKAARLKLDHAIQRLAMKDDEAAFLSAREAGLLWAEANRWQMEGQL